MGGMIISLTTISYLKSLLPLKRDNQIHECFDCDGKFGGDYLKASSTGHGVLIDQDGGIGPLSFVWTIAVGCEGYHQHRDDS